MSALSEIARMADRVRCEGPAKVLRVGTLRYERLRRQVAPVDFALERVRGRIGDFGGVRVVIDHSLPPMGWEVGE